MNSKAAESISDINIQRPFLPPQNEKELLFVRHVEDVWRVANQRGIFRCTGFLNDRQQLLAVAQLNKLQAGDYRFWGGFEECERKVLFVNADDDCIAGEISVIEITADIPQADFNHSSVLGSLTGLNLSRDAVGDIFVTEDHGKAFVAVKRHVAAMITDELHFVGRHNVKVVLVGNNLPAVATLQKAVQTASVASLRIDSVISAMLNVSRGTSEDLIHSGLVEINHVLMKNCHDQAYAGDVFSIHGKGKFCFKQIKGHSKKGRLFIEFYKY